MKLKQRLTSETPKFFKVIRNIGIGLIAAAGAIVASPVALPAALVAAAGYLATAGTVAAAVAQAVDKANEDN